MRNHKYIERIASYSPNYKLKHNESIDYQDSKSTIQLKNTSVSRMSQDTTDPYIPGTDKPKLKRKIAKILEMNSKLK